jgi:hypothetical protein
MSKRTANPTYRKNRAQLLRDAPNCHWCKKAKATQADHLIEADRGGDDSLENMVPSCGKCNAKRGQAYGTAKARARQAKRPYVPTATRTRKKKPETLLDSTPPCPRRPCNGVSARKKAKAGERDWNRPRLETAVPNVAGTYGPDVEKWAEEHLGVTFMPWQRYALERQLAYDAAGDWCNRTALVSTARQNGKSTLIAATIGWALLEWPKILGRPVKIVSAAHRLDLAVALFQELAPILEDKFGAKPSWTFGRNEVRHANSRWIVKAAKPQAPHGLAGVDLLIVDELWGVDTDTLDIGFMPTQRAVANPLALFYSTAGTEESKAMLTHREAAIRAIDTGQHNGTLLLEYSPPPELDPMTPEAWKYANPALVHEGNPKGTLTLRTIEREATAPNRAGFLRSSVNIWCQTDAGFLTPGMFEACRTDKRPLPGGVLACEVSIDDGRYVAVRCNVNADNVPTVTVALLADTVPSFWAAVRKQLEANPGVLLAITPTLDAHCPTDLAHRRMIVGYQEISRWTAVVKQMIAERRVLHTGETMLEEHVGRAVAVRTPGSIAISTAKSPGPVELCRCLIWAAALASKPQSNVRRPVIATANPRRVA